MFGRLFRFICDHSVHLFHEERNVDFIISTYANNMVLDYIIIFLMLESDINRIVMSHVYIIFFAINSLAASLVDITGSNTSLPS